MRTASWFSTGRVPGMARSTRLAWVFGAAPKVVALPEKIFDWVASCAWISSPITVSHCMWCSSILLCLRSPAAPPGGPPPRGGGGGGGGGLRTRPGCGCASR